MTDLAPVMAAGDWRTNAEMIADVARLGYLDGRVLDCTHGKGTFWKVWQPAELVACDLHPLKSPIGYSVDFTDLPFADGEFDAAVIDGPYKLNGRPTAKVDEPYGVHVPASRDGRHELIKAGITECIRVTRVGGHVLVKCQDQVNGGKVRWQTRIFAEHAEQLGCRLRDSFLFPSYRPQDAERGQQHARRNFSTLLVLVRERGVDARLPLGEGDLDG